MSDVTKCANAKHCPVNWKCYRHTAIDSPNNWQSYSNNIPVLDVTGNFISCDGFVRNMVTEETRSNTV